MRLDFRDAVLFQSHPGYVHADISEHHAPVVSVWSKEVLHRDDRVRTNPDAEYFIEFAILDDRCGNLEFASHLVTPGT